MDKLRVYLFSRPRIYWGNVSLGKFPTSKAQSLFGYLIIYRRRSHSRDKLATLFWEDSSNEDARRSLRTDLWRLRRYLDFGQHTDAVPLLINNQEISFNIEIDYWLDVEEFERGVAQVEAWEDEPTADQGHLSANQLRTLENIVELYQGDLIEGCYDDWCIYERERLQGTFLGMLEQLMTQYRATGLYDKAIRCGQRILAYDPLLEQVHREIMRAYCLVGNRPAALRQYRLCERLLDDELGIQPMEETTTLCLKLLRSNLLDLIANEQHVGVAG